MILQNSNIPPRISFKHSFLTGAFGITPIFVNRDSSIDCNLFNIYRNFNIERINFKHLSHNMERALAKNLKRQIKHFWIDYRHCLPNIEYHFKSDEEKQKIVNCAVDYQLLDYYCMQEIIKNSMHTKFDVTIDTFLKQGAKFVSEKLYYHAIQLFLYNRLNYGGILYTSSHTLNKIMTTNKDLLSQRRQGYPWLKRVLVPHYLLPENKVIIAARPKLTFDTGMLLCPIIYQNEYENWLIHNNINDNVMFTKFRQFPLMGREMLKFKVYEQYINERIPKKWYIEVFPKNVKGFYEVLHFLPS